MMEDDIELTGVARSAHARVKTKTFDTEQAESSGKDHGYYYRKPRLERYLSTLSTVAFSVTTLVSWEGLAASLTGTLVNGGPVSVVYGMMLASVGALAVAASLGELASINPTAGAQYHWTFELAPVAPRFLSFIQGWITVFAWIATAASIPFLTGSIIEMLIAMHHPTYVPQQWHGMLFMWAILIIPILVNVYARKLLPTFEVFGGTLHILVFPAMIITLVLLAPRNTSEFAWTYFFSGLTGWENRGVIWSIGMLSQISTMNGFDSVLHMSEEVEDAKSVVPRAMIAGVSINAVLAIAFAITIVYTMGNIAPIILSQSPYPMLNIFLSITKSKPATSVMASLIIITVGVAVFNNLASATRLTWAFARDNGLPLSRFFRRISPKHKIPVNSLLLVSLVMILITLLNLINTAAFMAVLSLSAVALYTSYAIPIILLVVKRVYLPAEIRWGPFCLGRWGLPINLFAIAYSIYVVPFVTFPPILPVTATNMNYAAPVLVAVLIFAVLDWVFRGLFVWNGPISKTTRVER